jgi:hypothetical protein
VVLLAGKKMVCFTTFILKLVLLPRQARDKHM